MYNLSRQAKIDKIMCKPGYTWNETLERCLPAYGGSFEEPDKPSKPKPDKPANPDQPIEIQKPPEQAIMEEKIKRAAVAAKPVK